MKLLQRRTNVPYVYTKKNPKYPDEFAEALETFGVEKNGKYDFTKCKNPFLCFVMEFGVDNLQLKELIAIGYPQEKNEMVQGGMQSWLSVGLSTIKTIKILFFKAKP